MTTAESKQHRIDALIAEDQWLEPHRDILKSRVDYFDDVLQRIEKHENSLVDFARSYRRYGFQRVDGGVSFREWAPGAKKMAIIGEFNDWNKAANICEKDEFGTWTAFIPDVDGKCAIAHDSRLKLVIVGADEREIERFSTWSHFVRQEGNTPVFNARFWNPEKPYEWKHKSPLDANETHTLDNSLRIYEAHVGMASEEGRVATYAEFARDVLPYIKEIGYNCVQLMAIMEHSYYASFGYQVTAFYAPTSRCGTPEDLKAMIDVAHELGILVLLDIVHSHASRNEDDGVSNFDGSNKHYFHGGSRGEHPQWNSRLFDYGQYETRRFLLANVAYWLEEFHFDGLRFDGVTSMLYTHHGLDACDFFNKDQCDIDALTYLTLATRVAESVRPGAVTIAEEVSGWPALCRSHAVGGVGFAYRLAMAIPDLWIKYLKHFSDDQWQMGELVYTLTNRPHGQKSVVCVQCFVAKTLSFAHIAQAYCESHDQALVGDKTIAFWLMDADMYTDMTVLKTPSERVVRGIALHKLIRLLTCALGGEAWLCFMGNEFGHPEWLDFPREGNGWSYHHCRRQWHLARDKLLRYGHLLAFDKAMLQLESRHNWLRAEQAYVSLKNEGDKVIAFDRPRGQLYFVFNFHSWKTYEQYHIGVDREGEYKLMLHSEQSEFGGRGVTLTQSFTAQPTVPGQQHAESKPFFVSVDLLPRSVIAFEFVETK